MVDNSLRFNQVEEHFYNELLEHGYPEDRIEFEYKLLDSFRATFVVMAPGISKLPLAVFVVKGFGESSVAADREVSKHIEEDYGSAFYVCVENSSGYVMKKFEKGIGVEASLPTYQSLLKSFRKHIGTISELSIENFTVFRHATLNFSQQLNVIIGENGSGKTQLLKLLYVISSGLFNNRRADGKDYMQSLMDLQEIFHVERKQLVNRKCQDQAINVAVSLGNKTEFSIDWGKHREVFSMYPRNNHVLSSVYLPARELLSLYPHFLSLYKSYKEQLPYDKTVEDTITFLGLPVLHSQTKMLKDICKIIETSLQANFYHDSKSDTFMMKKQGEETPYEIDMTAEGWRKIGEVLQLLRNGAITEGGILLWDEPEANQNPALIKLIAEIIWKLSQSGVQVFLATHSLFLMRELEYLSNATHKKKSVRYICLHADKPLEQADSTAELKDIVAFEAEVAQEGRILSFNG